MRLRLGDLAPEISRLHLLGGAGLTGIGFTISLLIVDLSLPDDGSADQARVGVLAASVLAAVLGWTLLRLAARRHPAGTAEDQKVLDPPVDPDRDHIRGPLDAPLVLVEYGDFECPFCGAATGAVEDLRARLGDRLQYVFRHMPHRTEHPHAELAAEAAEAAAAQGRYWDMHDRLFAHPEHLRSTDLLEHAAALGLDLPRFARDLGQRRHARRVEQDLASGAASGVSGIPAFFVGGRRYTGPSDTEHLLAALEGDTAPDERRSPQAPPAHQMARLRGHVPDAHVPLPPQEAPETPDADGALVRLSPAQIDRLAQHGHRRAVTRGEFLHSSGDVVANFTVLLDGAVAVVEDTFSRNDGHVTVHGPGRFLGEMDMLSGQPVTRSAVVVRDGEILELDETARHATLGADPEVRDLVLRTFLLRRAMLLDATPDVRVVARAGTGDAEHLQQVITRRGLTIDVVELDDHDADHLLQGLGPDADLPQVLLRDGRVLHAPDGDQLETALDNRA